MLKSHIRTSPIHEKINIVPNAVTKILLTYLCGNSLALDILHPNIFEV